MPRSAGHFDFYGSVHSPSDSTIRKKSLRIPRNELTDMPGYLLPFIFLQKVTRT